MKEKVIDYLIKTYNPEAIILYGSYADESSNSHSDFDALIIADSTKVHDESVIDGITLDVFIYSSNIDKEDIDLDEFIQIHDGIIVLDKSGIALRLKRRVLEYIENIPFKTDDEIQQEIEWCRKMLLRTKRNDSEGFFRWHWLLMDSLEIYYDVRKKRYWGPKKALLQMKENDPEAYKKYEAALEDFQQETLTCWIDYLSRLIS